MYFLKKNYIKRSLCFIVAAALCLFASSCSNKGSEQSSPDTNPASSKALPDESIYTETEDGRNKTVLINEDYVNFFGRTFPDDADCYHFNWSGSGFSFAIDGDFAAAQFSVAQIEESGEKLVIGVIVDGNDEPDDISRIEITESEKYYTLAKNLGSGQHTIKVVKLTENGIFDLSVSSLMLSKDDYLIRTDDVISLEPESSGPAHTDIKSSPRRIEFIGGSLTCGDNITEYGIYGDQDVLLSYAALTAKMLKADCNIIASYNLSCETALSFFPYTDKYNNDSLLWDFNRFKPDAVVINLPSKDLSLLSGASDGSSFTDSYKALLATVRDAYPRAEIWATIDSGNTHLFPLIQKAADSLKDAGDSGIHTLLLTQIDSGSADEAAHTAAATRLVEDIATVLRW